MTSKPPYFLFTNKSSAIENIASFYFMREIKKGRTRFEQEDFFKVCHSIYTAKTLFKKTEIFDTANMHCWILRGNARCTKADNYLACLISEDLAYSSESLVDLFLTANGKYRISRDAQRFAIALPESAKQLAKHLKTNLESILITAASISVPTDSRDDI